MSLFFSFVFFAIAIAAIVIIIRTTLRPVRKQRQSRYNPYDEYGRTPQLLREMAKLGIAAEKNNKKKTKPTQKLDLGHNEFAKKNRNKAPDIFQLIPKRDISISKFRRLTKMVNGQEDVARRLIEGNLSMFPDKSTDWACDKAISDVERDRR